MATNRDKSVCLVIKAKNIATKGGNKHSIPKCVSICKSPPVYASVVYRAIKVDESKMACGMGEGVEWAQVKFFLVSPLLSVHKG